MKLDILAIAVHPDDAELGCAGTLMMEKSRGKKVGIVDLTRGELGTRGNAEIRHKESARAAEIMGLDLRENLGMADGFFQNDGQHQRLLIGAIRKYRPEIVLANALADRHPEHRDRVALVQSGGTVELGGHADAVDRVLDERPADGRHHHGQHQSRCNEGEYLPPGAAHLQSW